MPMASTRREKRTLLFAFGVVALFFILLAAGNAIPQISSAGEFSVLKAPSSSPPVAQTVQQVRSIYVSNHRVYEDVYEKDATASGPGVLRERDIFTQLNLRPLSFQTYTEPFELDAQDPANTFFIIDN